MYVSFKINKALHIGKLTIEWTYLNSGKLLCRLDSGSPLSALGLNIGGIYKVILFGIQLYSTLAQGIELLFFLKKIKITFA